MPTVRTDNLDDPIIGGRRLSELVDAGMVDPAQARLLPVVLPAPAPAPVSPVVSRWPLVLELPMPPTTNNLFINACGRRGRVMSPKYRAWKETVAPLLRGIPAVKEYPVAITLTIVWGKGWLCTSDVANREKAAVDALVEAGILERDSCEYVTRVVSQITKPNRKVPTRFLVRVEPAS